MRRILPVLLILASLYVLSLPKSERGNVFSTYTHTYNDKPIIRVVSHHENYCFGICGAIYVFQKFEYGNWREITAFRHDDTVEFPRQNLKIENENLAYFWIGWKFGATTDGGEKWTVWDGEKDNLMKDSINYGLIESVTIHPDGKGKMNFNALGEKRSGAAFLETEDFGKTWHR